MLNHKGVTQVEKEDRERVVEDRHREARSRQFGLLQQSTTGWVA